MSLECARRTLCERTLAARDLGTRRGVAHERDLLPAPQQGRDDDERDRASMRDAVYAVSLAGRG